MQTIQAGERLPISIHCSYISHNHLALESTVCVMFLNDIYFLVYFTL